MPPRGAGRLNKALHFARRVLTADHIRLRGELLSLEADPPWDCTNHRGASRGVAFPQMGSEVTDSVAGPLVYVRGTDVFHGGSG
jgi:hypothetical protein